MIENKNLYLYWQRLGECLSEKVGFFDRKTEQNKQKIVYNIEAETFMCISIDVWVFLRIKFGGQNTFHFCPKKVGYFNNFRNKRGEFELEFASFLQWTSVFKSCFLREGSQFLNWGAEMAFQMACDAYICSTFSKAETKQIYTNSDFCCTRKKRRTWSWQCPGVFFFL